MVDFVAQLLDGIVLPRTYIRTKSLHQLCANRLIRGKLLFPPLDHIRTVCFEFLLGEVGCSRNKKLSCPK